MPDADGNSAGTAASFPAAASGVVVLFLALKKKKKKKKSGTDREREQPDSARSRRGFFAVLVGTWTCSHPFLFFFFFCCPPQKKRGKVMDWSGWTGEEPYEDEEPSVDYMEYLARRASCSVLPDPPKALVPQKMGAVFIFSKIPPPPDVF